MVLYLHVTEGHENETADLTLNFFLSRTSEDYGAKGNTSAVTKGCIRGTIEPGKLGVWGMVIAIDSARSPEVIGVSFNFHVQRRFPSSSQ